MDIYQLNRHFWDFAFENTGKIKPNHIAVYQFAIEHCNRLGWKKQFGFPTSMVLDAVNIKSYSVYKSTFDDLVEFGFFEVIEYSKNQYSSNIIALKENYKALDKALDKALITHSTKHKLKQGESIEQSKDSIDIQINNSTILQTNNSTNTQIPPKVVFNFKNSLIDYGFEENLVDDWLKIRKSKKATNTETAFKKFISEIEKTNKDKNEILEIIITKSWKGFENAWLNNNEYGKINKRIDSGNNTSFGTF